MLRNRASAPPLGIPSDHSNVSCTRAQLSNNKMGGRVKVNVAPACAENAPRHHFRISHPLGLHCTCMRSLLPSQNAELENENQGRARVGASHLLILLCAYMRPPLSNQHAGLQSENKCIAVCAKNAPRLCLGTRLLCILHSSAGPICVGRVRVLQGERRIF